MRKYPMNIQKSICNPGVPGLRMARHPTFQRLDFTARSGRECPAVFIESTRPTNIVSTPAKLPPVRGQSNAYIAKSVTAAESTRLNIGWNYFALRGYEKTSSVSTSRHLHDLFWSCLAA